MINCLIIEDEQLAAERLSSLIVEMFDDIRIIGNTPSISKSINFISNNKIDLIFMDIHLSDGLSFKIMEQIRVDTPIIFTTAYDKYAIKAFKYNSIDYLLKPINEDELKVSIEKFKKIKKASDIDINKLINSFSHANREYKKRFLVQIGTKIKSIEVSNIAYFYALDKAVYLTVKSGASYIIDNTLDSLEDILDEDKFFRINRKMIINSESIENMEAYTRGRVFISLKPNLPKGIESIVSIDRSSEFKSWLNK